MKAQNDMLDTKPRKLTERKIKLQYPLSASAIAKQLGNGWTRDMVVGLADKLKLKDDPKHCHVFTYPSGTKCYYSKDMVDYLNAIIDGRERTSAMDIGDIESLKKELSTEAAKIRFAGRKKKVVG